MATDDQNDMYPSDGMDETTASQDTSSSGDDSQAADGGQDDESAEGETFLAPKSVLGDCKVGDMVQMKVCHIYSDEVELCPAEDEAKEGADDSMEGAMSKMDSMATDGEM